jgi:hypothetical protein
MIIAGIGFFPIKSADAEVIRKKIAVIDFDVQGSDKSIGVAYSRALHASLRNKANIDLVSLDDIDSAARRAEPGKIIDELKAMKVDLVVTGRVTLLKEFVGKKQVSEFVDKNIERTSYWVEIEIINAATGAVDNKLQDRVEDLNKFQTSAIGIAATIEKLYPVVIKEEPKKEPEKAEAAKAAEPKKSFEVIGGLSSDLGLGGFSDLHQSGIGLGFAFRTDIGSVKTMASTDFLYVSSSLGYVKSISSFNLFANAGYYDFTVFNSVIITPYVGLGTIVHYIKDDGKNDPSRKYTFSGSYYMNPVFKLSALFQYRVSEKWGISVIPSLNILFGGKKTAILLGLFAGASYSF